jgi:uncharacterized protein YkwD
LAAPDRTRPLRNLLLSAVVALLLSTLALFAAQRSSAPDIRVSRLEQRIFDTVNEERSHKKLTALRLDVQLTHVARAHSEDMMTRRFFDHINPDGEDATARGKRAGYACLKRVERLRYRDGLGENLFDEPRFSRVRITDRQRTYDWNTLEDIARQAVDGWMHSTGHRRNILERAYDRTGVGVAVSDEHVYLTQLFC